ncbi:HD domain-containing protein [Halodesulfovibrio sp.]|jgi:predicted hydrolase (HD superfamily)|uniref:HD domain-containing protein n=1 Tax=Halodesulfovibrio sp. TaxID=1912772 RepID=UPI0025F822F6|nr:HD domain-containing protein [Halodesulfovibrio sp.]MCT4534686.1 HD domain-containing protein [Halodesulfovibrio sp.]
MKNTIDRESAITLLQKYVRSKTVYFHSIESEAIMRNVAQKLQATHPEENIDIDLWAITALLHDLDSELTTDDLARHGVETVKLLQKEGYEIPEMFQAILSHTEALGFSEIKRTTKMDYALAASENMTGIISAYVKMRPTKKIDGLKAKSITKKIKDRSFAASVNREFINDVDKHLGLDRSEFVTLSIDAMTEIADQIGM